MVLCYSGKSAPSAQAIADEDDDIVTVRHGRGDVNWGRSCANARLNPDITNATNKRRMRELFREHDVPMPKLLSSGHSILDLRYGFNGWEYPIVGRPDTHSKKRGFWLCRNMADVDRAIRGTRRKRAATHFMEYVNADREYRVHIFQGRSIRVSEKDFFIDENGKRDYKTIKPTGEYAHVRAAAKKAVEALGLDFGAVDVLATDDKCWVLEVNAAPGLGGSMPRVYAEAFKRWYEKQ
jgi:carbamoylphosphate synthase large subunit